EVAQQEIDQLQKQISATPPSGPPAPTEQESRHNDVLASIGSISGPVELKPLSNDPIPAIHMVEDVKVIYQAIDKAAGINVLLDPSVKIYVVPSQNAIVMRATPDELLIAQKLLNDLDRGRPEVVVDVAVLEVNKNVERNLGITLPQSVTITPQATPTTTSSTT